MGMIQRIGNLNTEDYCTAKVVEGIDSIDVVIWAYDRLVVARYGYAHHTFANRSEVEARYTRQLMERLDEHPGNHVVRFIAEFTRDADNNDVGVVSIKPLTEAGRIDPTYVAECWLEGGFYYED